MADATRQAPEDFTKRVSGLVLALHRHFPFFGMLIESCSIHCDLDGRVPTACVDRHGRMTVSPSFAARLTDLQLMFVLAHEVCHVAFEHFNRTGTRDRAMFNVACDHAINLILADSFANPAAIPEGTLLEEDHRDLSAEEIYERMRREADDSPGSLAGDLDFEGEKAGPPMRSSRLPGVAPDGDEWRRTIAAAASHAKFRGKFPASLERFVEKHLHPKVDWATQLRQHLRFGLARTGREQYTFLPCNRRHLAAGLYLPSLIGAGSPRLAFAIDTSGSMGAEEIGQALGEIDAIRRQFECPVFVIDCDAEVHTGRWVGVHEPLAAPRGGGGTDFRPVFKHLEDARVAVDVVVYLTDGYGEFGPESRFPTIWVMTTDVRPPWGEFVQVSVDA